MTVSGVVRSVEGNRQEDDFLLNCREQSLETSRGVQGLTGGGDGVAGMQGPWAGGFPSRFCSLLSEADRLFISLVAS